MYPWHPLFYRIQSPLVNNAYKLIQKAMARPISPNITATDVLTALLLGGAILYSGTSIQTSKRILLSPPTTTMTEVAGYSETSAHF